MLEGLSDEMGWSLLYGRIEFCATFAGGIK